MVRLLGFTHGHRLLSRLVMHEDHLGHVSGYDSRLATAPQKLSAQRPQGFHLKGNPRAGSVSFHPKALVTQCKDVRLQSCNFGRQ